MRTRKFVLAGTAMVAGLLLAASASWACTGDQTHQPYIAQLAPNQALPLTTVTATGGNWAPGTVSLVWQPAGTALASATVDAHGSFTQAFVVPSVGSGPYNVSAVQGSKTVSTPLDVARSGAVSQAVDQSAASTGDTGGPANGAMATSVGGGAALPSRTQPAVNAPDPLAGAPVPGLPGGPPSARGGAERGQVAVLDPVSGLPVGSVSIPAPAAPSEAAKGGEVLAPSVLPHPASSGDDLWAGFARPGKSAPSLMHLPTSTPLPSGLPLQIGLAFAAVLAMVLGFGLAELRRTRAAIVVRS